MTENRKSSQTYNPPLTIAKRFRGFLPVVVDIESGGLNPITDALLEVAIVFIKVDDHGKFVPNVTHAKHIIPFAGANLDPVAMEITGIKIDHPFRFAETENEALRELYKIIRTEVKRNDCKRACLVGHNPWFDLSFLQAAVRRNDIKRDPFHQFTTIDTASLAALSVGHTVLAESAKRLHIEFDANEAHSAIYDVERTAEIFCEVLNRWHTLGGWQPWWEEKR